MAQTRELFKVYKKAFRSIFGNSFIYKISRWLVENMVNVIAQWRNFSFPLKFNWEWKLEMLLNLYESETTRLFRKIVLSNMVVIDIGAHVGYFTRIFAEQTGNNGHVYAFEADEENLSLLKKNTNTLVNTTIVPRAVSDQTGELNFFHIYGSTGCHSTVQPNEPSELRSVQACTLDAFCKENFINKVDLIKIDIEGGEPRALAGMQETLKNNREILLVSEVNPQSLENSGSSAEEYLKKLGELDFRIYVLSKEGPVEIIGNLKGTRLSRTGYVNVLCCRSPIEKINGF